MWTQTLAEDSWVTDRQTDTGPNLPQGTGSRRVRVSADTDGRLHHPAELLHLMPARRLGAGRLALGRRWKSMLPELGSANEVPTVKAYSDFSMLIFPPEDSFLT